MLAGGRNAAAADVDEVPELAPGDVEGEVVARELRSVLAQAAQQLPRAQRLTFVMHDVRGYSSAEIAGLEHVPYHTVRTRLWRARREMRKFVTERGLVA